MITVQNTLPLIHLKYNKNLLSVPTCVFSSENLIKISDWLLEKIERDEFKKFPATLVKLKQQHKQFMELYELCKIKEKEAKGKPFIKANSLFYRPRLGNKHDELLFERLEHRRKTSISDRRSNEISKI